MTAPLTHHDIIRHAAPLTARGLRVNMDHSDRAARIIVFHVRQLTPDTGLHECFSLSVLADNGVELCRAVGDNAGLIATLTARADELLPLVDVFFEMDKEQLFVQGDHYSLALSYTLEPLTGEAIGSRLQLQQLVGRCDRLELRTDVSTTFGMPADTVLLEVTDTARQRAKTLANGTVTPEATLAARTLAASLPGMNASGQTVHAASKASNRFRKQDLPDDLLALLGPQWRPLVWQGGYWKTVMRQLGTEPKRSQLAREHGIAAMRHLANVRQLGPYKYHQQYASARQRAWLRRLRPIMLLMAIMATAPVFWAATTYTGFRLHPMAMGLTPLLLMGVVMMTSREFPIMELPSFPKSLNPKRWALTRPGESLPEATLPESRNQTS